MTNRPSVSISIRESGCARAVAKDLPTQGAVSIFVTSAPNTGKSLILSKIMQGLTELEIPKENIELHSEENSFPFDERAARIMESESVRQLIQSQRYELYETQLITPISLDPSGDFERFKGLVDKMSNEWLEKKGDVTCEFSTGPGHLAMKLDYLYVMSKVGVKWRLYRCETCMERHGEVAPYHVEISDKGE